MDANKHIDGTRDREQENREPIRANVQGGRAKREGGGEGLLPWVTVTPSRSATVTDSSPGTLRTGTEPRAMERKISMVLGFARFGPSEGAIGEPHRGKNCDSTFSSPLAISGAQGRRG